MKTIQACAAFVVNITAVDQRHSSANEKAEGIAGAIRLFATICPDGNYGCHRAYVASLELLHSLYLWFDNRHDDAFVALENAKEHGLRFIQICEDGVAHYTAPLVRLAEEKPGCSADIARQDYHILAGNWLWWTVPEVEQVKQKFRQIPGGMSGWQVHSG